MLQMLDSRFERAAIQVGNAYIVMIIGGPQDGAGVFLNLLLAGVNQNLGASLDFRLVRVFGNEVFETLDGFFEILGVHQLDTGFVSLYGAGEVFRPDSCGRRGAGRDRRCH